MKRTLHYIVLAVVALAFMVPDLPAAPAPLGRNPLTWRLDDIITGAEAIKADNRTLEDGIADANRKVIKVDDAWRKAMNKMAAEHAEEVANLKRQLKKFDHWYVRAVIHVAAWIKVIAIAYGVLCLVSVGTSFLAPGSAAFMFGRFLFNNLPFMGWTQILSSRSVMPPKA